MYILKFCAAAGARGKHRGTAPGIAKSLKHTMLRGKKMRIIKPCASAEVRGQRPRDYNAVERRTQHGE